MKKRVLYVIFQWLDRFPPSLSQVCMLRDLGVEVVVLTSGIHEPARKLLEEKGITLERFEIKTGANPLGRKIENFCSYRKAIRNLIKKYWTDNTVLWVGTEKTAMKMDLFLRGIHPRIQSCMEFYEDADYQKQMKPLAQRADILTACEPHRAAYMMDWWKLEKLPYVLRNKPYGQIPPKGEGSTPEIRQAIEKIKGKKVLLYQGSLSATHDLSHLAKILAQADSDFYLVLMGWLHADGNVQLEHLYPKTMYLGYFPAPQHLEITPYATAAVAFYPDNCINNRYCAPNKIHEYAGCGTPMLCSRVPGLTDTVGAAGAAECVDFSDPAQVIGGLKRIEENYEAYHRAALGFYDSVDNRPVMKQILEDGFSRTKAAEV